MVERISEAEHAVMEVLWDEAPLTAAAVSARSPASRQWSAQTVKTLLARLVSKGVAAAEAEGRRFLYRPLIAREDYVGQESQRMIDRLFAGRVSPLVAQLAQREALSEQDIAEIEALIRGLRA